MHQLRRAREFAQRRAEIADLYDAAFQDLPLIRPPRPPAGDQHPWHLYVIRLSDESPVGRDEFIERLYRLGIGCSVHYIPLHQHPYWRARYRLTPDQFQNSQRAFDRMVSLPIYTRMTPHDQDRVIAAVRDLLSHSSGR